MHVAVMHTVQMCQKGTLLPAQVMRMQRHPHHELTVEQIEIAVSPYKVHIGIYTQIAGEPHHKGQMKISQSLSGCFQCLHRVFQVVEN
jgi:hypothetical protein